MDRTYAGEAVEARRTRGVSTLVTGPTVEPITVALFKQHSRIDDTDLDAVLLPLRIAAARRWCEHYTGRALLDQTWAYAVDWLADGHIPLLLPKTPLLSVTSIKTYDPDDTETTVPSSDYRVDTAAGRVLLDPAVGYWVSNPRYYGRLLVTYRAGYGTAAESVPEDIRHAVFLLAGEFYERLEATTDQDLQDVPFGVKALLDPYRTEV